jgi:hypothetical protein
MNTSMPSAAHLEKLQNLTRNYAQFSRNKAGLGFLVLVGLLPVDYLLARILPLNVTGAILGGLLCVMSIGLWFVLRSKIVAFQYQQGGIARVAKPLFDREYFFGFLLGVAIIAFRFRSFSGLNGQLPNTFDLVVPTLIIMAIMAFREYRHNGIAAGAVILAIGILISGGINANASNLTEIQQSLNFWVLMAIPTAFSIHAILEHLQFKRLQSELESLKSKQS